MIGAGERIQIQLEITGAGGGQMQVAVRGFHKIPTIGNIDPIPVELPPNATIGYIHTALSVLFNALAKQEKTSVIQPATQLH